MGSSDDLRVGEQVIAIGNALGYGQSVTTGIVSTKNRKLDDSGLSEEDSDGVDLIDRCSDRPGKQRRRAPEHER